VTKKRAIEQLKDMADQLEKLEKKRVKLKSEVKDLVKAMEAHMQEHFPGFAASRGQFASPGDGWDDLVALYEELTTDPKTEKVRSTKGAKGAKA